MFKIFLLLFTCSVLIYADNFTQSKKILKDIYKDHQTTFYCGCQYSYADKENMIDKSSCGYVPRIPITKKGKINERTTRIEWEHIMPAENFGKHLPCWKEGGRKACQSDPVFTKMEADMMNLVPAVGELNGDRSNYRYGANEPKVGQYGQCNFEVDFEASRAYVRPEIRGDIARVYLYMSQKYNINLSKQETQLMEAWNKLDPIDNWEREKIKLVQKY